MLGYAASVSVLLAWPHRQKVACCAYLAGFAAYLLHAVFAFHAFYEWSHAVAWLETRRQTELTTGLSSGDGLYLNYALGLVWMTDSLLWLTTGQPLHRRNYVAATGVHGFFLFMLVTGGIVFASGPVRWFTTMLLILILASAVFRYARQRSEGRRA